MGDPFSPHQVPAPTPYATSSKTSGCRAAIFSSTFAGPVGVRRPCSQFCNVSALMPKMAANLDCDKPSLPRTRAMLDSGLTWDDSSRGKGSSLDLDPFTRAYRVAVTLICPPGLTGLNP